MVGPKLTNKQWAAIFAAKNAGVSKRDVFEHDVVMKKWERVPKDEQEKIFKSPTAQRRIIITDKMRNQIRKDQAINEMQRTGTKKIFLKEPIGMTELERKRLK